MSSVDKIFIPLQNGVIFSPDCNNVPIKALVQYALDTLADGP